MKDSAKGGNVKALTKKEGSTAESDDPTSCKVNVLCRGSQNNIPGEHFHDRRIAPSSTCKGKLVAEGEPEIRTETELVSTLGTNLA